MKKLFILSIGIGLVLAKNASAQVLYDESWENSLDGWIVGNGTMRLAGFSSTLGVTEGSYSVGLGAPLGAPNYGIQFYSPGSTALTLALANASTLSLDVYVPPDDFGSLLTFDLLVSQKGFGTFSLDSFTFSQSADIGGEKTLIWNVSSIVQTAAAADPSLPISLLFEIGGGSTSPSDVVYLDNLQVLAAPEPSTMALAGLGAAGSLAIRRRKA